MHDSPLQILHGFRDADVAAAGLIDDILYPHYLPSLLGWFGLSFWTSMIDLDYRSRWSFDV